VSDETKPSEPAEPPSEGNGAAPPGEDPAEQTASESERQSAPVDPLEAAQAELQRTRDQLLRTAADFDNFRKRSRREISDAERRSREDLLRDLLPVFDNLERAASHAESASDVQSLVDGIRMVMRQFIDTLSRLGVERIESEGAPFDPALMEAIQHLETTSHGPGTVTNQVQAGYRMGDRLIRPAMVVVAKSPPS
jgi:molecular chaperone GrpE